MISDILTVGGGLAPKALGKVGSALNLGVEANLFRGASRPPDVIFKEGFKPKGTDANLRDYVWNNRQPSVFVGTSRSESVAIDYAKSRSGGYVYTIRDQPHGLDVNAVLGKDSPFKHQVEVAVPGGIKPGDIRGARPVDENGNYTGPFVNNPYYIK